MGIVLEIFGGLSLIAGTLFLFMGGLGLLRMPDVFNRIQAGTKATTLGTLLVLIGAALLQPDWGLKLLLVGVFLLFTNPLSSQVLARAAHRSGAHKSSKTLVDQLEQDLGEKP